MPQIPCSVLRPADHGDCTNGGVSSHVSRVIVIWDTPGPHPQEINGTPVLVVVRRDVRGMGEYCHCAPVAADGNPRWGAAGGNYVTTTDSRFRVAFPYPLPVHDRFE